MSTQTGHYLEADWKHCMWCSYQSRWGRRRLAVRRRRTVFHPVTARSIQKHSNRQIRIHFKAFLSFACTKDWNGRSEWGRRGVSEGVSLEIELWRRWKVYLIYSQGKNDLLALYSTHLVQWMWKRYKAITMPQSLLNWMTDVVYSPSRFCNVTVIAAYWCKHQQQGLACHYGRTAQRLKAAFISVYNGFATC